MGDYYTMGNHPDPRLWGGQWEPDAAAPDLTSVHAVNAATAAYQADVAVKSAASLAQWFQYLSVTVGHLQSKVTELEDWKRRALEDVRKLREEHRVLQQRVLEDCAAAEQSEVTVQNSELVMVAAGKLPTTGDEELGVPLKVSLDMLSMGDIGATPLVTPGSPSPATPLGFGGAGLEAATKEGVRVASSAVHGVLCELAEWRIGNISAKLRGCMGGRALVSPPFSLLGLEDLRLMICPDGLPAQGSRSRRQKELYLKKITEGPLEACLRIKIPSCPTALEMEYYLKVGPQRCGPFKHNFAESPVGECDDFGVDWLKQLDADHSLTVCVEIVHKNGNGTLQN